ncbi:MAG: hypothetical protein LAO03_16135 [Acidobacteriia bacterium]|nr:hypothetical protein [Terriglobia bacterium]
MAEKSPLEQIVEKVVSQVLESHVPQLRDDLVRRVLDGLPQALATSEPSAGTSDSSAANLLKAIVAIHAGATQREILRALLDNTIRYCGRVALFVIKGGTATGWEARGFENNDGIKNFSLDVNSGVASRALQSRMVFSGTRADVDPGFVAKVSAPGDDHVLFLPLLLKDKVAALVYADAGTDTAGKMDNAALEVLVTSTSAWLEVASLRKQAQKEGGAEAGGGERPEPAPPVQKVSSFSDPFAAHAPLHAPGHSTPAAEAAAAESPAVEESPVAVAEAPPQAGDAFSQMSPEDAEVHRKAQRFARLLVDEIKLYNQAKVAEGRKNRDLYDRMKEDIEKSRATYLKRYGNTAAAGADYFSHELVRSLAEDDTSLMGGNFRR